MHNEHLRPDTPLMRPGVHIPALDGLRGIAILLVLAIHFAVMRPLREVDAAVFALARTGWVGVDLFFVLSGFLITGILWDHRARPNSLRVFYARRFLRIFPLYYGFLLLVFAVGPWVVPGSAWLAEVRAGQWWHWAYLSNVLAALEGWGAVPHLGHFWSLAIEEQFYLLWPLAVLRLSRRGILATCAALLGVSLAARVALLGAGASPIAVYALTFTRWDGLAVGAAVAILARSPAGARWLRRVSGPVMLIAAPLFAAMVWAAPYRSHYGTAMQIAGYPIVALAFGALLVRVLDARPGSPVERVLRLPVLGVFGRYSYGIYLLHGPLLGWLLAHGVRPGMVPALWRSALPGQLLFWVVATGATLALALVSWHLLERPFLRLKRHFEYEHTAPARAEASPPVLSPVPG